MMAELVDAIRRDRPAAIALDILMPEADASVAGAGARARPARSDAALAEAIADRPSNDALLARALAAAGAVLVVAGMPEPTGMPLRAPPFTVHDAQAGASGCEPARARSRRVSRRADEHRHAGSRGVRARPHFRRSRRRRHPAHSARRQCQRHAGAGARHRDAARRRIGAPVGAPARFRIERSKALSTGDFVVPTEADGAVRIYYSPRNAAALRFGPRRPRRQGRSGAPRAEARADRRHRARPARIPEHARGRAHARQRDPRAAPREPLRRHVAAPARTGRRGSRRRSSSMLGGWLVYATPRWKPRQRGTADGRRCLAARGGRVRRLSRRSACSSTRRRPPSGLMLLFGVLLVLTLTEATRQKKALERMVQVGREQTARIAGELEAARRIQTATLPRADLLAGDRRIDIAATMIPARETGGDLYDYFRLDERRLFFLVGDVAGKGLSASIFMAVSKALYKSATLRAQRCRHRRAHVGGQCRSVARQSGNAVRHRIRRDPRSRNRPISQYCNAGHENPFLIHADDAQVRRIEDGDGPPLCAMSDFAYSGARYAMRPGELLVRGDRRRDGSAESRGRVVRQRARAKRSCRRLARGASDRARRGRCAARRRGSFRRGRGTRGRPHDPRVAVARSRRRRLTREGRHRSGPRGSSGALAPPAFSARLISTRRLRGSATPSAVGTNSSRFPRPMATMFSGAIPFWISPARMTSARCARQLIVELIACRPNPYGRRPGHRARGASRFPRTPAHDLLGFVGRVRPCPRRSRA